MDNGYAIVIGSLNYDILFKQERLPLKGETLTADSVGFSGGGKGANQAVQCAKLGLKTYMVGKIGSDHFGDYLFDSLTEYKVDTSFLGRSKENTGIGSVNVLSDGSVHATISTGANYDITKEDIDQIDELIRNSSMVILQMEIPMPVIEYAIKKASEHGVYVMLNAAPAKDIDTEVLKLVDCLVVNEVEASFYMGEKIESVKAATDHYKQLLEKVKTTLIITLGAHGALLCNQVGAKHFVPVNTIEVVETTGAGDSFIGGFAYGKSIGKSDEEACAFAGKASAITITKVGAQSAMPTLDEIKLKERKEA